MEPVSGTALTLFCVLAASLLILMNAVPIGEALKVMDHPDAFRKRHLHATPLVGGLAIMVPLLLWGATLLLWLPVTSPALIKCIVLCGCGATLVGYADDQSSTSPSSRLLSLFLLAAIALVLDPDLVPHRFNWGSFIPTEIPAWLGFSFVVVAMAGYVNAVNMADGQNGIVTGMYTIWAACLMCASTGAAASTAQILFATGFMTFLFNMAGRVFIGDTGSYGVTFVFGILAIYAHNKLGVTAETIAVWFFVPVMDCLRLMATRALRGAAPSDADRNHLHHHLQDRVGKSWGLAIYLSVVGISSLAATLRPQLALVCMVLITSFYFSFAWLSTTSNADEIVETDPASRTDKILRMESKGRSAKR